MPGQGEPLVHTPWQGAVGAWDAWDCGQSEMQVEKISPARCEEWDGEKQQWVDVWTG